MNRAMNNTSQRVADCFTNVFPRLRKEDLQRASTSSLASWDSVAHITLLAAVAEEFGVEFAADDFEELTSFPLIVAHVEKRMQQG
jgi:acyl carrier protein